MMKTIRFVAVAFAAAALSGCGGPSDFSPVDGMSVADMYVSACQSCHGENGEGMFGFLLKIAGTDESMEQVAALLKDGGHIMPSFPHLNAEQRLTLAAYIKAL